MVTLLSIVAALSLGCRPRSPSDMPGAPADATMSAASPGADFGEAAVSNDSDPAGLFAYTEPGELPQLHIAGDDTSTLPLEHTDVAAQVRGHVARVRVTQRFVNDRAKPIEVVYTFPLPENAAVDDMRMVIGERVIHSEVRERNEALATYQGARAAGYTAALLEQERPNVFTQSVANVPPGEVIEVEIAYLQTLTQDAGRYEFVFPMVVGPRFVPGTPLAGASSGTGRLADTDAVPDASRITPPVVGQGQRSGNDVSLTLDVDAGLGIDHWIAPTHTVIGMATARGFSARLADAETIPNRDFVIRWMAADSIPRATLFMGPRDPAGFGHFSLLIQPPQMDLDAIVGRREMIFVVDRSGSMSGVPLALAKLTLRTALQRLRPVDTFDVVGFESSTERLFGTPRPANEHNLVLAERFIDGIQAGGGTMMADAVEAALAPRLSEGRHRYVFFLTDGYIGNESQIIEAAGELVDRAERAGGRARVFGLGIGAAPNDALIAGLSRAGQGVPLFVSNREHPAEVVDRYYRLVDHAVLEDLRVEWGGLTVEGVVPARLPDLFASHTVVVHGRFRGEPTGPIWLRATPSGQLAAITIPVEVAASELDDRILSTLWGRARIEDLSTRWDDPLGASRHEIEMMIRDIGLAYHLVTAYTSLVAVDRSRVVGDGNPSLQVQPIEVPEDVDPIGSGAWSSVGRSTMAGTTASEQKYTIDGANLTGPSYGTVGASIVNEYVEVGEIGELGGNWAPAAKLSLGELSVSAGISKRDVKHVLRDRSLMFEACYIQHQQQRRRTLSYRLEVDAHGRLTTVTLLTGTLGSEAANACIETVLHGVDWATLPGAVIDLELALRLR
jgi:Ca-activated chloride channel family protein